MTVFALLVVMAHQSDWLSMVLVLIPLTGFALILGLAKHRAERDGPVTLGADAFDPETPEDRQPYS